MLASTVPEVTIQAEAGELPLRVLVIYGFVLYTVSTLSKLCLG